MNTNYPSSVWIMLFIFLLALFYLFMRETMAYKRQNTTYPKFHKWIVILRSIGNGKSNICTRVDVSLHRTYSEFVGFQWLPEESEKCVEYFRQLQVFS